MPVSIPTIVTILISVFSGRNWWAVLADQAGVSVATACRYRSGTTDMGAQRLMTLARRNRAFRAEMMAALRMMDELDDADGDSAAPGSLGAAARDVVRADRRLVGAEGGQPAALVTP